MSFSFRSLLALFLGVLLLSFVGAPPVAAQSPDTVQSQGEMSSEVAQDTSKEKDAPFVPTPDFAVKKMLSLAGVTSDDVVYDLGSGDGRIPIMAAEEFGARGIGYEIDTALVAKARQKAKEAGVSDKVEFRVKDLFKADLSEATVVALYLWPEINLKLRPKLLEELDPGDRIVSHDFRMGDWEPDTTVKAGYGNTGQEIVYVWTVPETIPEDLKNISNELDSE